MFENLKEKIVDNKKMVIATTVALTMVIATSVTIVAINSGKNKDKVKNNDITMSQQNRVSMGDYSAEVVCGDTVSASELLEDAINAANSGVTPLSNVAKSFDYMAHIGDEDVKATFEDGKETCKFDKVGVTKMVITVEAGTGMYEYNVSVAVVEEATQGATEGVTESATEGTTASGEETTEGETTTTASEESTENTETEVVSPSSSEEVEGNTENSGEGAGESNVQQPVSTQVPVVTQPPVQTTAKPVQTTVATTKAPAPTTTVATQPPVDESNSITRNGYYGKAWDFWNGGRDTAYCWVSSTHIIAYDFIYNKVVIDYELSGQEYTDFMYVYNNEIACGGYPADAISKGFKYINNLRTLGRDRVLYTNDIEDDGICSSVWSVWITSDGEYWWTA